MLALGFSEAAMLLRNPGSVRVDAIISIAGQREHHVDVGTVPHKLLLRFDDTEAPDPNDPLSEARLSYRRREAAAVGLDLSPPTRDDAERIVEFADLITGMDGSLLCHCQAGVSRSPAAALLCLAAWTGPGNESFCLQHLLQVRPCAMPHADLIRFGDEILRRDGALVEALRKSGLA